MNLRLKSLLCTLLVPVFAAGAPIPSTSPPLFPQPYPSQPNAQENPLRYPAPSGPNAKARLAYWSEQSLRTIAIDHTPPPAGPFPYSEQRGPTHSSRVAAIVHLAVYDALNAIYKRYPGYSGNLAAFAGSSPDAAIAQAAHDTLVVLYPHQASRLDAVLKADLARLPDCRAKQDGIDIGRRAAAAILALRANDGAYLPDPIVGQDYPYYTEPGKWRPDPVSQNPYAVGAYWGQVRPFVIPSAAQYRAPPPPALGSDAYARAFNEVKQVGGAGLTMPTRRTLDQTRIGIFWAYDDSAWLGTVLRLHNQIALQLAYPRAKDALDLAHVMGMVNAALADTTIAVWETKYYYVFWRPVQGVREASPGTGPTGKGDGNPDTLAAPNWTPLGSPASNLVGPNFTPYFPSYPSGHAGTGAAMFETLRKFYGDNIPFTFVSDELNGITRDNQGHPRPRLPRSYSTLSQAEAEAGQSRIYLGVHWQFDRTAAAAIGRGVAGYVFQHGLVRPVQ